MPKVYTKKGDGGMTGLYSGERRMKDDPVFKMLGANDELTSRIGAAISEMDTTSRRVAQLRQIQQWLQFINSDMATLRAHEPFFAPPPDGTGIPDQAGQLEAWIDEMDGDLAPLTTFILPGGDSPAAAQLHLCRTAARTAEREIVGWAADADRGDIQRFINRLSDYFFTAARWAEEVGKRDDTPTPAPAPAKKEEMSPECGIAMTGTIILAAMGILCFAIEHASYAS